MHAVVGVAWRVGPPAAPASDYRPDLLGPIELCDAQIAEIFADAVEPAAPVALGAFRQLLVVVAGLIGRDDGAELCLI